VNYFLTEDFLLCYKVENFKVDLSRDLIYLS